MTGNEAETGQGQNNSVGRNTSMTRGPDTREADFTEPVTHKPILDAEAQKFEELFKHKGRKKRHFNLYYILIKTDKGGWKEYTTRQTEIGMEICFDEAVKQGHIVRVAKDGKVIRTNEKEGK
jgi:hypothetical protein